MSRPWSPAHSGRPREAAEPYRSPDTVLSRPARYRLQRNRDRTAVDSAPKSLSYPKHRPVGEQRAAGISALHSALHREAPPESRRSEVLLRLRPLEATRLRLGLSTRHPQPLTTLPPKEQMRR